jgi:hypothetical protein
MATIVDEIPPAERGAAKYPWDEWLNGQNWKLVRGIDFQVPTATFRSGAASIGRRRGLAVKTRVIGNDVYVCATAPTEGRP